MAIQNPKLKAAFSELKAEWDAMWKVTRAAEAWVKEDVERECKHMPSLKKAEDTLLEAVKAWRKLNGR